MSGRRPVGKILVVDDEPTVRASASAILQQFGYDVVTAVDGQDAVERAAAEGESIRLVLLDYAMPRMDGEAAFHAIREIIPTVRIILSSGYSTADLARRLYDSGLDACLPKPYGAGELAGMVGRLLHTDVAPLSGPLAGLPDGSRDGYDGRVA